MSTIEMLLSSPPEDAQVSKSMVVDVVRFRAHFGQNQARVGRTRAMLCRCRTDTCRLRANAFRNWPNSGRSWSYAGRCWSNAGCLVDSGCWTNLVEVRPNLVDAGPNLVDADRLWPNFGGFGQASGAHSSDLDDLPGDEGPDLGRGAGKAEGRPNPSLDRLTPSPHPVALRGCHGRTPSSIYDLCRLRHARDDMSRNFITIQHFRIAWYLAY